MLLVMQKVLAQQHLNGEHMPKVAITTMVQLYVEQPHLVNTHMQKVYIPLQVVKEVILKAMLTSEMMVLIPQ